MIRLLYCYIIISLDVSIIIVFYYYMIILLCHYMIILLYDVLIIILLACSYDYYSILDYHIILY